MAVAAAVAVAVAVAVVVAVTVAAAAAVAVAVAVAMGHCWHARNLPGIVPMYRVPRTAHTARPVRTTRIGNLAVLCRYRVPHHRTSGMSLHGLDLRGLAGVGAGTIWRRGHKKQRFQ